MTDAIALYFAEVKRLESRIDEAIANLGPRHPHYQNEAYLAERQRILADCHIDRTAALTSTADPDVRRRIDAVDAAFVVFINASATGEPDRGFNAANFALSKALRELEPFTGEPTRTTTADDQEKRLARMVMDENAAKIVAIAGTTSLSANERMMKIIEIDRTYAGRSSPEWSDLLNVTEQAIRNTPTWKGLQSVPNDD